MFRAGQKEDIKACLKIANTLSGEEGYFDEKGIQDIGKDLKTVPFYVFDDGLVKGFIVFKEIDEEVMDLTWLAVKKEFWNQGVGNVLLSEGIKTLKDKKVLQVKTLDESIKYAPYEKTRSFYEKRGFKKIKVIENYPGWDPGNPMCYLRKGNYMKPKEIDFGFRIDDSKLWDFDIPVEEIPIADLAFNFDIPYLEKEGTDDWNLSINELINNFEKEITHARRVKGVDLSFPIQIYNHNGNWIVLDGIHRLTKAIMEGHKTIKVRRVSKEQLESCRVAKK